VISLNADTLVLRSDVIGTVKLPRARVNAIHLGTNAPAVLGTNQTGALLPQAAPAGQVRGLPNSGAGTPTGGASALAGQSPNEILAGATPEAQAKFSELAGGLMSGKLSAEDIRAEARSVAAQVRAMRAELGEDAGGALDAYLAILDRFIGESPSQPAPAAPPAPKKTP
jgi:hypothetical protein